MRLGEGWYFFIFSRGSVRRHTDGINWEQIETKGRALQAHLHTQLIERMLLTYSGSRVSGDSKLGEVESLWKERSFCMWASG